MSAAPLSTNDDLALAVAARRSCDRQWLSFVEALAQALPEAVGDETSLAVLDRVGRTIAQAHALPRCASLTELKAALNAALGALDWGHLELREEGRHLELVVVGYPHLPSVAGQAVFAATLEAALDEWLAQQASRRDLVVRLRTAGQGAYPALVYHYERSDGG